jgi:hypothetical protein
LASKELEQEGPEEPLYTALQADMKPSPGEEVGLADSELEGVLLRERVLLGVWLGEGELEGVLLEEGVPEGEGAAP